MAISLVGTPQVGSAIDGADLTLTFSTAPSENDYVIVYGGAGSFVTPNPTDPGTGYTQIALYSNASSLWFGVWIKKMGASPDTSVLCHGNANSASGAAYGCYVLRGVELTTPQDATATTSGPTTSTNPNCPSITTANDGAWVLALAGSAVADATPGTVSGYSNQYNANGNDSGLDITVASATLEKTIAGAEDPGAWSSWASGKWYAVTVALRPAAGGGGWANISKINRITSSTISKINRVPVAEIGKVNRVPV